MAIQMCKSALFESATSLAYILSVSMVNDHVYCRLGKLKMLPRRRST